MGFLEFSEAKKIVGVDVSSSSLAEATDRLLLHPNFEKCELIQISPGAPLPFADNSFDLIHSSGVLHHVEDLQGTLVELRRVLKPGGQIQLMVYHRDSIWFHLYVPYQLQILEEKHAGLSSLDAFRKSTDGVNCPISNCYSSGEFHEILVSAGFVDACFSGAAVSAFELSLLPLRPKALLDRRLNRLHREFLYDLTFDDRGLPRYRGTVAGIDGVFRCRK